jgi:thioredoxin 1
MKRLIKFGAPWCQSCRVLDKQLNQLSLDIEIEYVDIDENTDKTTEFKIRGVPTLVYMEDGKEIRRKSGVLMADQIEELIK